MTDDFTATLPRKRMGAGALLTDGQDRVLLVEPTYKPYWEIPGGSVEVDELRSWAWCTEREAGERLSELLARRITAAARARARAEGTVVYLENGFFVA